MASLTLFISTFLVVSVIGQPTEYNCNQRPPITPDIKNCCKRPTVNLDNYKSVCYNITASGRRGGDNRAFMNPCAVECIYTQAGALNNGEFDMRNLRALLNEIMPKDPEMANSFFAGFQKCAPEVRRNMQEFEASQPANAQPSPYAGPQCSPYAVITSFCAMRHTFINCPASSWTTSEICTRAQQYVKNCEPLQFGGPRNNIRNGRRPSTTS